MQNFDYGRKILLHISSNIIPSQVRVVGYLASLKESLLDSPKCLWLLSCSQVGKGPKTPSQSSSKLVYISGWLSFFRHSWFKLFRDLLCKYQILQKPVNHPFMQVRCLEVRKPLKHAGQGYLRTKFGNHWVKSKDFHGLEMYGSYKASCKFVTRIVHWSSPFNQK